MSKEQFIEIIKGFDIKEIEEYKIKYKDWENHSVTIQLGFDEEDNNDVNVANTIIFELQDRIDEAIKLLEKYLDREYVITDEYFEYIIEILKGSDEE